MELTSTTNMNNAVTIFDFNLLPLSFVSF